jgi:hypothetical protein
MTPVHILAKKSRCMDHIRRKAIETELHPDNMNRERGISLTKSWKPYLQTMKEQKKALSKEK